MPEIKVSGYWRVSSRGVKHFVRPYSRNKGETMPRPGDKGTWLEKRTYTLLRWRDPSGKKRSRMIPAHLWDKPDLRGIDTGAIMSDSGTDVLVPTTLTNKRASLPGVESTQQALTSHVVAHGQGFAHYKLTFPNGKSCT